MNPNCNTASPPQKPPNEGWGPHGSPECYYTSHVLDSTARYVRFVKKLRAMEEEQRIGLLNNKQQEKDSIILSLFNHCDRKALIHKVAQRVDLCLESYEQDLQEKRNRLMKLLAEEEEYNTRLFVEHGQAGMDLLWQDKMKRLEYLLDKRKKEQDSKLSVTPLDKCTHLQSCLVSIRNKESRDIQLYQMREKQMRRESEREIDKMWHELAMKESEALAARMEYDVIERKRRDKEISDYTLYQIEMARQKRAREQEILKQEALLLRADAEAYYKKEEEEKRGRDEASKALSQEKKEIVREREEILAKQKEQDRLLEDTWASLAETSAEEDKVKEQRKRQMERDLDQCNFKLADMKNHVAAMKGSSDAMILKLGQEFQDATDLRRCQYKKGIHNRHMENQKFNRKVAEDHIKEGQHLNNEEDSQEYERQLREQLDELVKQKQLTDAQARKLYQSDLRKQIEYNKLLKERAAKEELQERQKCLIVRQEYQDEIGRMLGRPYFSNSVHPFLKQMASGLKMKNTCPCSAPTFCAEALMPQPSDNK